MPNVDVCCGRVRRSSRLQVPRPGAGNDASVASAGGVQPDAPAYMSSSDRAWIETTIAQRMANLQDTQQRLQTQQRLLLMGEATYGAEQPAANVTQLIELAVSYNEYAQQRVRQRNASRAKRPLPVNALCYDPNHPQADAKRCDKCHPCTCARAKLSPANTPWHHSRQEGCTQLDDRRCM
ncbi:hypothetical protein DUNSADRAFT_3997 [Dunaliella salina]|uniref:Uncharacterized protein n=1 Tax=Dunaliella salina TaxID=3046 RepID=A0ABQ7FV20_DUNSA|nr:hypothetical protein DUNSADRAFT_3997 [Dunaliella salina]|eukprot:KAF5826243.1 hypothetical protein DUNSADRAFT_3997 [Dunaliella salina]